MKGDISAPKKVNFPMCFLCFRDLFIFYQELTSFHLKLQWPALPGAKSNKRKSSAIIGALVCRVFHGTKCRCGRTILQFFQCSSSLLPKRRQGRKNTFSKSPSKDCFAFLNFVAHSYLFLCCQLLFAASCPGLNAFLVAFHSCCLLSLLPWIPGAFYPGCFLSSLPWIHVAFYLPPSTGAPAAER